MADWSWGDNETAARGSASPVSGRLVNVFGAADAHVISEWVETRRRTATGRLEETISLDQAMACLLNGIPVAIDTGFKEYPFVRVDGEERGEHE